MIKHGRKVIIKATGIVDYIVVIVDTEDAYTIAPFRTIDPIIDAAFRSMIEGCSEVYGRTMMADSASPWGIINCLRELGYDVPQPESYIEPVDADDDYERPEGFVF